MLYFYFNRNIECIKKLLKAPKDIFTFDPPKYQLDSHSYQKKKF